jgi:3-oxoacyl-[acyl-carrier-protein] synthase-3
MSLEAVAGYLPPTRVPIADLAGELGLTPMQVRLAQRVLGLSEIRVDRHPDRDATLLDLLGAAVGKLDALRGREQQVRFVLHARSMPVAVPYPVNPLHELCREIGLSHAIAFTVTQQACASGLLALDLAGRLLAGCGDPSALALVLAGEKTFTYDARLIPGTCVFGEAAAACLVGQNGERDRLLTYVTRNYGEFDGRISKLPDLAAAFGKVYPDLLADIVIAALARVGLDLSDIALVLPHNVNKVSWRRLCRTVGLPLEKVLLDNVPVVGHSFCADAFLNYATALEQGRLNPGDRYLVVAVGSGATFSAMVFEH